MTIDDLTNMFTFFCLGGEWCSSDNCFQTIWSQEEVLNVDLALGLRLFVWQTPENFSKVTVIFLEQI